MKTSEILAKFNDSTSRIARAMRRFAELYFGNFSWRPPGWLSGTAAGWGGFLRAHPRLILSAMIAIFVISCGGACTWHCYSHLPTPRDAAAEIVPIELTNLENALK